MRTKPHHPVPPLRDVVYQRGESLLSVATSCGVPYADLVEVAEGRRLPSSDAATAVATHFAVEPVDLFGDADTRRTGPSKAGARPEPKEHVLTPADEMPPFTRTNLGRGWRSVVYINAGAQPVREVLQAFGVSRKDFTVEYGITYAELTEVMRGNRVPHPDTVAVLTGATRLPVEKLFTEDVRSHL